MRGGKRQNAGRKIGSKGLRTIEWEQFGKQLLGEGNLTRALEIMNRAKDDDFMKYFTTLSEYFKPKLARSEVEINPSGQAITIIRKVIANGNNPKPDLHSGAE